MGKTKRPTSGPPPDNDLPYRTLFEAARDGMVLIFGGSGRISRVNRAFSEMSGYAPHELEGKLLWEIGPLRETDAAQVALKELETRPHIFYDDLPFLKKDGARLNIELNCSLYRSDGTAITYCSFRDVTRRKEIEEERWRSEARFQALFRHAPLGIALLRADGRIIDTNSSLDRMFGYTAGELRGRSFTEFSGPDDVATDEMHLQELLEGKRASYHLAKQFIRKDGGTSWGLLGVALVRAPNGDIQFIIRMVEDITQRKIAEDSVIRSREYYRSLLNELPNPIRVADTDGKCDYFNRAWLDFTGRLPNQEAGDGWMDDIHPADAERVRTLYQGSLREQRPFTVEYRLRHAGGGFRWVIEYGNPYRGIEGRFAGYISSCVDIHERKALQDTLETISISDDLTGLLNRRGFFTLAQQQIKVANRTKRRLFLIYGDLDGLKQVNDSLGHAAGDLMLVETAGLLREVFRESDIIARLGGDEFAVLLTEDSATPDAGVVLNRLREAIRVHNDRAPGGQPISLSIGLEAYDPENPSSFDKLISQADSHMYAEKKKRKAL